MRGLVVVWIAVVAAGCFNPAYNDPACSPAGECPDGLSCVNGVCRSGGSLDADVDAPQIDAARPDAIPAGQCDPISGADCVVGEKCGLRRPGDAPATIECYPNGGIGDGGACSIDAQGYDDCRGGLACVSGRCRVMCTLSPDSCAATAACVQYAGVYEDTGFEGSLGLCVHRCDPVTQVRLDGDVCGAGNGCYGAPNGPFVCAPEINPAGTHGFIPGNPVYINSCAAGYHPYQTVTATDTRLKCSAMCRPVPTDTTQPGGAGGAPGSGYTCGDRGAGIAECRFVSFIQDPEQPGFGEYDAVGFCLDYQMQQFDGAPMPRCTMLSPTIDMNGNGQPDIYDVGCHPL